MGNKKPCDEKVKNLVRPTFIVDDFNDDAMDDVLEEWNDDDECFDSICAFCENGGSLLVVMECAWGHFMLLRRMVQNLFATCLVLLKR